MILPADVELDKETLVFAEAGETEALSAVVTPGNALIKDVIWKSSDETVAKVDGNGVVTAVGEGEAVITVTTVLPYLANDTCTVKVAAYHHVAAHPVVATPVYMGGRKMSDVFGDIAQLRILSTELSFLSKTVRCFFVFGIYAFFAALISKKHCRK